MVGKLVRSGISDDKIVEAYRSTQSVFKAAKLLGVGATTVHRRLHILNEPLNGLAEYRRNITKFRGQEQAIREMYDGGATIKEIVEHFGEATHYAVKSAVKRAGGVLRENPIPRLKPGEVEAIRDLRAKGLGQAKISIAIGRSQLFVSRTMRANGIESRRDARGAKHSQWNGGRYKDTSGYSRVWVSRDDPMAVMALSDHHVLEHRLVMARKLGRPLLRSETVHHIDGDKTNNSPENLQLRQGKHGKHVVMCCLDCGSRNIGPAALD